MDAETERLIARTRQRRELLNQKMGKTPEAAPRKRRTPLSEDLTSVNVPEEPEQENADDSPKRQCMRDIEQTIKDDTPAIPSVRSRLQNLASQHAQFSQSTAGEVEEASTPVPAPRKSLSSPPLERARPKADHLENSQPSSSRRKRFAQLADHINNWEDDLSHPTIAKEEEKKPRWKPPTATAATPTPSRISSPKKTRAPPPPTSTATSSYNQTPKTLTSTSSLSARSPNSPARTGSKVGFNSTPKPFQPYSERTARPTTVRSPASASNLPKQVRTQNDLPGSQRDKVVGKQTPKTAPKPPVKQMSACRAGWEQKTETASAGASTPWSGMASSTPVSRSLQQTCTPARPPSTPTQGEGQEVQMRPKVRKSIDDEPTAHSVSARMSAWEQISSAQVVSDIKKVKPGSVTPTKTPTPSSSTPGFVRSTLRGSVRATPGKSASLTPSKSFKDSIKERAAQVNPVTAAEAQGSPSPDKAKSLSPKKASSAMKAVQQQLVQQTQSTSMAERIRQERMAELQSIQERWKNGILNEETPAGEIPKADTVSKREDTREQVRADFDKKLASIGLGTPAAEGSSGKPTAASAQKAEPPSSTTTPKAPPVPPPLLPSSSSKVTAKPAHSSSLFKIVSQKKKENVVGSSTPVSAPSPGKTGRRVKFNDSFDSDDDYKTPIPPKQVFEENTVTTPVTGLKDDVSESDTSEESQTEDDTEVVLRRPPRPGNMQQRPRQYDDDDDLSLSAFVPASVRRQSILPSPQQQHGNEHRRDTSTESSDREPRVPPYSHQSTRDHGRRQQTYPETESSSSLTSQSSAGSDADRLDPQPHSGYRPDDTEDSGDDRNAIGDLLDEAMDSSESEDLAASADRRHTPVMRKRSSHRKATEDGNLPFSINEYRASRNMQVLEVKQTIVRNSQYSGRKVEEEMVEMPSHPPTPAPRQSVQERVRELQELVHQEQNVILQTSNALNQCCSTSHFAGSAEQVECNRILLIACQKRQTYMMEIQRLRDTKILDPSGPGPKGSLTISDIRLPLKKEFVTKIGTSHDTTTFYFIVLLRNGPQVISTQMLSTHDPMMRGSLDFPNLVKINGITGSFKVQLEIYSMSVSREALGKGKKKKTPKKAGKSGSLSVQSPAGPVATRTTSFSQVTTVALTMKSLDKRSFNLERLSHLSPLHGTIYMNLRCLMEANVEERGFLTMFEDVSGLGSWHRRWCALSGNKLQYWKYPDDETRKDPMGYIDLKRCVTEKVGLISRDVCARPHTFELSTVRQPRRGEKDTLVSRTYNTMTTVRHMLSADTKEERIVWCNKVNQALANIRTWHSDAMRPIR